MKGVCRRRNENWFARYFRGEAPFLQTYYFGGLVFSILALFAVWLLPDLCAPNSRIVSFMYYLSAAAAGHYAAVMRSAARLDAAFPMRNISAVFTTIGLVVFPTAFAFGSMTVYWAVMAVAYFGFRLLVKRTD